MSLFLGLLCIGVSTILDLMIRLRLKDAGEKWVFWRGGTLDYGEYLKQRPKHGWAAWPVYLIPAFLLIGAALIVYWLSQRT